jgi:tripartite-type tricarboxylate transporter receptor subunit TctC
LINAGRLRVLAVTSRNRSPALPAVPTLNESGFPGFDMVTWQGMFAPAGTPPALVERLNLELTAILRSPEIRQRVYDQGGQIGANTPEEFARFIRDEAVKWSKVIKDSGAKLDI